MAIGKYSDFQIYEDEFYGGFNETLMQNATVFNGASRNAIRMIPQMSEGNFQKEAFFTDIASLVTRRDITSVSAATDLALASDQFIRPKVNRKIGPVANTFDSLRKIASNQQEFSFLLGEKVAQASLEDFLNTSLTAGVAALLGVTTGGPAGVGVVIDKSSASSNTMQYDYLIEALAAFGDKASNIVAWVMHSKAFYDLMKTNVDVATDRVAGATIYEGTVGTLGRPVVVTDSADLIKSDGITTGTDSYYALGLTADGLLVIESEERQIVADTVTGLENLVIRIQGEYAFNIGVKGFSYTDTGVNPADAAVGTTANWTNKMDSVKNLAGVIIETA